MSCGRAIDGKSHDVQSESILDNADRARSAAAQLIELVASRMNFTRFDSWPDDFHAVLEQLAPGSDYGES